MLEMKNPCFWHQMGVLPSIGVALKEWVNEATDCHWNPSCCLQCFSKWCSILSICLNLHRVWWPFGYWFITVNMLSQNPNYRKSKRCQYRLKRLNQRIDACSGLNKTYITLISSSSVCEGKRAEIAQ